MSLLNRLKVDRKDSTITICARVNRDNFKQVKRYLKSNDITIATFVDAAISQLLEDIKVSDVRRRSLYNAPFLDKTDENQLILDAITKENDGGLH